MYSTLAHAGRIIDAPTLCSVLKEKILPGFPGDSLLAVDEDDLALPIISSPPPTGTPAPLRLLCEGGSG